VWADLTVNDSTGSQLRILYKKDDGSDVYVLATASDYEKALGASDIKILYPFDVKAAQNIIVQTKATDLGVSVTPAYLEGGNNPQPNSANWEAVTDGSFRITLNGTPYNIDGIDFSGDASLADVAATIQAALRAVTGSVETVAWIGGSNWFLFTTNDDIHSSILVLDTSTGTVGTDISGEPGGNVWLDCEAGSGASVTPAVVTGSVGKINIDVTKS
jgi:hypothetical protein